MTVPTAARTEWTISVRGAHKRYGDNILFRDLDLLVSPGRAVRIDGPNGSGKTQFLYALCGLVPLDLGEITVRNDRETSVSTSAYDRDKIFRFVPALPANLTELSVEEFVHVVSRNLHPYSLARRSHLVANAFARFRLELEGATGRQLNVGLPVSHLSIGQQKRLMLAATINSERPPKVLVVDEPLAALDASGMHEMIRLLLSARSRGIALVIAEHRAEINAVEFDEIISMPYGTHDGNGTATGLGTLPRLPESATGATCLTLDSVEAGYPGSCVHCHHFELSSGSVAIISGENGSGKTGFLKALAGISPASLDGETHFSGENVKDLAVAMRHSRVRYMPQNRDNFLQMNVADAMLAASLSDDKHDSVFEGVVALIGKRKRVGNLSSGNRALLSLAQTLAARPQLALLDEPFANVDLSNRHRMAAMIEHACREFSTAFLIVEHGSMDSPRAARYTVCQDGNRSYLRLER